MSFFKLTLGSRKFWEETVIGLGLTIALFCVMLFVCWLTILWPPTMIIALALGITALIVWDAKSNKYTKSN